MQPGAQSEVLGAGMCVADAIASPADAVPAPRLPTLAPTSRRSGSMSIEPRMRRLFAADGRCFDVAVDHGGFFGEPRFSQASRT